MFILCRPDALNGIQPRRTVVSGGFRAFSSSDEDPLLFRDEPP
ncbi:hypothetical protein HMPREF3036_01319 [Sutterella sp. KLE1602]|nr:hypothetical protein HMPREF3036_01319 [Sutterella sp. KLE1602]